MRVQLKSTRHQVLFSLSSIYHFIFLSVSAFFLNGEGLQSSVWSPTPASAVYFSGLLRDWPSVTMAATLAVGSGGRTSQLLRWTACREHRGQDVKNAVSCTSNILLPKLINFSSE